MHSMLYTISSYSHVSQPKEVTGQGLVLLTRPSYLALSLVYINLFYYIYIYNLLVINTYNIIFFIRFYAHMG